MRCKVFYKIGGGILPLLLSLLVSVPVFATEEEQVESLVDRHISLESSAEDNPYSIVAYKPTYIAVTYNDDPYNTNYPLETGEKLDRTEIKFQISMKIPLTHDLFGTGADVAVGYTQQSWWQLFNDEISSPFRETNYEPELMFSWSDMRYRLPGFDGRGLRFAVVHQSNGRAQPRSRSWNRVYVSTLLEHGRWVMVPRVWYRLPEEEKEDPLDPSGDDNPDIDDYMGYGDLLAGYRFDHQSLSLLLRNNLQSDNKGAVQIDWSFPLSGRLRGYVQYFNGYGESLIDYNQYVERIGVGVQLTDWLR